MATPIMQRIRTAALANAGLVALIGQNWYDTQLPQLATFPAIVAQQISGPRIYVNAARLNAYFARFQFTIWAGQFAAGANARDAVFAALAAFLDATPFDGITGRAQNPNFIVGDRQMGFVQTDGVLFQRIVDAMLYVNESL